MRYGLRKMLLLCMLLPLMGCASAPPINAIQTACSAILPEAWRQPVPGAPLPRAETLQDYAVFADAQTAQLDKAVDRALSTIAIVERCEARDAAAAKRARKRWWQVLK